MTETIRTLGSLLDLMPVGNTTGEIGAQDRRDADVSHRSIAPQESVLSRGLNTPPVGPTNGDRYIIGTAPTGDWAGQADSVAEFSGNVALGTNGWLFFPATKGMHAFDRGSNLFDVFNGTVWENLQVFGTLTLRGDDRVAVDTTTASTTFVNLLTETLVLTETSIVFLVLTCSFSNASGAAQIARVELRVNGTLIDACGEKTDLANGPQTMALVYADKLDPGTYTFDINWKVSGGTLQCRPVTDPDDEHARIDILVFRT